VFRTNDRYVRVTMLFAPVPILIAVGQRFRARAVRVGVNTLAVRLLAYGLYTAVTLPRL